MEFYLNPILQGWDRTVKRLFLSKSVRKYALLGVVAWLLDITVGLNLAGRLLFLHVVDGEALAQWSRDAVISSDLNLEEAQRILLGVWAEHGGTILAVAGVFVVIALIAMWVWAHAEFILLHNVINDSAEIVSPWRAYASKANALFIFQVVLNVVVLLVHLGTLLVAGYAIWYFHDNSTLAMTVLLGIMLVVPLQVLLLIVFAYVRVFTFSFVLPLMVRFDMGILEGWSYFGRLFRANVWRFLVFGIFYLGVAIILGVLLGIVAMSSGVFVTKWYGNILQIPYLSALVYLPAAYFFRAYTLDFLSQFDESYRLLPEDE